MVSIFLVFVATLASAWGALFLYETSILNGAVSGNDLLVAFLLWGIAAIFFGSAAILDGLKTAAREMSKKLEELAG